MKNFLISFLISFTAGVVAFFVSGSFIAMTSSGSGSTGVGEGLLVLAFGVGTFFVFTIAFIVFYIVRYFRSKKNPPKHTYGDKEVK